MYEVYRHPDAPRVGAYKSLLEEAGIPCFIRNETADSSLMGSSIAIPDLYPVLCVMTPEQLEFASRLIEEVEKKDEATEEVPQPTADWICASCGEDVPKEFFVCWNCRTDYEESLKQRSASKG